MIINSHESHSRSLGVKPEHQISLLAEVQARFSKRAKHCSRSFKKITWRRQGHRLNSPNDLAFSKRGDLYFTDPPFGFHLLREDPSFAAFGIAGVYRIKKEAMEAARASENIAPEPELVEKGMSCRDGVLSHGGARRFIAILSSRSLNRSRLVRGNINAHTSAEIRTIFSLFRQLWTSRCRSSIAI